MKFTSRTAWLLVALFTLSMFAAGAHASGTTLVGGISQSGWSSISGGEFQRLIGTVDSPVTARVWGTATGGAMSAAETAALNGVRGPLSISSTLGVAAGEAAAVIGRCLGSPLCVAGSTAAVAAYSYYRAKPEANVTDPTSPTPSNTVQWDAGTVPTTTTCNGYTMGWIPTGQPRTTCDPAVWCSGRAASLAGSGVVSGTLTGSGAGLACQEKLANGSVFNTDGVGIGNPGTVVNNPCTPSTVDGYDNTVATFDGKCRSGVYSHALIAAMQATIAAGGYPANGSQHATDWANAVKNAVDTGGQTATATITTTGPATQTGTPTVTTTVVGGATTTDTATPTTNYTYSGDTITYNNTYVDVKNDGTTTTTTTTTNPQDPSDPCTNNPTRAGCSILGVPPTDSVTPTTKNVAYTPEDVGVAGSCPADHMLPFHGWNLPIHWQPLCDAAPTVKLAMVALAGLIAAGIVVRAVAAS